MKTTNESTTTLIDACIACAIVCYVNASKCEGMEGMEDCYRLCIKCADACEKVIEELRGNTEDLINTVAQCARICSECAKEFAKHDNIHCQKCSSNCLKCAEICTRFLVGQEIALEPVQQVA